MSKWNHLRIETKPLKIEANRKREGEKCVIALNSNIHKIQQKIVLNSLAFQLE